MSTIKDIANLTGFSITTVSRALNNHDDVNETTKKKIRTAAEKLNYSPNLSAKRLVQKQSKTIGFIVSNLTPISIIDNFSFNIFMGSSNRANQFLYEVILIQINSNLQKNKNFNQIISERNLDGAILHGFNKNSNFCQDALYSNCPVVFIDIPLCNETSSFVSSNLIDAFEKAISYLTSLGHKDIGFIHGYTRSYITDSWLKAYNDFKDKYSYPTIHIINGEYSDIKTSDILLKLLPKQKNITAFFCASDVMAIGAIQACKKLGLNIPENISIMGFDNILLSKYFSPTISSISQNPYEFGEKAFDLLLNIITTQKQVDPIILETTLIKRESTSDAPHDI